MAALSRRRFLRLLVSAGALAIGACLPTTQRGPRPSPAATLGPPAPVTLLPSPAEVRADAALTLGWRPAANADRYDVELNGQIISRGQADQTVLLGDGDGGFGLVEGRNAWRVCAKNAAGEEWSPEGKFEVVPAAGVRARHFDLEDDGPIPVTAGSSGAALVVGSSFAYGAIGKGAALRCWDVNQARAYKNHLQLPLDDCWVRMAIRAEDWGSDGARVTLARIRSRSTDSSERLIWVTGRELRSSSIKNGVPIPARGWIQVQLGVLMTGRVELWVFDGLNERLVGEGVNRNLIDRGKDVVAVGNDAPRVAATFEVLIDEIAIGERKLPWLKRDPEAARTTLQQLDPAALPPVFSFVFGSCNVSTWVPYRGFALNAAADAEPDFVIHLGDNCYPDTGAYQQTTPGYLALWSDLLYEEQLGRLARRPWLYLASDHDLGGNNIDRVSLLPAASDAFVRWQSNPRSHDPQGGFGSIDLDDGRIRLIWLDAISYRSPVSDTDGPDKTLLGSAQKAWLLDALASRQAGLIIIASQTTVGHASDTGWSQYPSERRTILQACRSSGATIRWITGDYHSARWTRMGTSMAEWGAAPLAEVPQVFPGLADEVDEGVSLGIPAELEGKTGTRRAQILSVLTQDQLRAASSFGWVEIDTMAGVARFEVRDHQGDVRVDPSGFRFAETVRYR
jgi:hypothetical protein